MYESPKLVRFGQFRDLTLQGGCLTQAPWTGKNQDTYDSLFPKGNDDGCPPARS
jgi:hypothetical protein